MLSDEKCFQLTDLEMTLDYKVARWDNTLYTDVQGRVLSHSPI